MERQVTSLLWKSEMLAFDQRLRKVLERFVGLIALLANLHSEAQPPTVLEKLPAPFWFTDIDEALVDFLLGSWGPSVNTMIQTSMPAVVTPAEQAQVFAEHVVAMKPLSTDARRQIAEEILDLDEAEVVAEVIRRRLVNLVRVHVELCSEMSPDRWRKLKKNQRSRVKSQFPHAISADYDLLDKLVRWREGLQTKFIDEDTQSTTNLASKAEALSWFQQRLDAIAADSAPADPLPK